MSSFLTRKITTKGIINMTKGNCASCKKAIPDSNYNNACPNCGATLISGFCSDTKGNLFLGDKMIRRSDGSFVS